MAFRVRVLVPSLLLLAAGGCAGPSRASLVTAYDEARDAALAAADRSLEWLDGPGASAAFPGGDPPVSRDATRAAVAEIRRLLLESETAGAFADAVRDRFDARRTEDVLFTGYFAPEYAASRVRTDRFRFPLYTKPPDPERHTRRRIEDEGALDGHELVWLEDALDRYLVHVNGSARLRLPDGEAMHVGYVTTNGHEYTSLGRLMIDAGLSSEAEMSMQTIRRVYDETPETVRDLMRRNDRYAFFREIGGARWPLGSLGVPLTAEASIASDRAFFAPAGVALLEATVPDPHGRPRRFVRIVFHQDVGGAIKGPARADIYLGAGDAAGEIAGRLKAEGRLLHLFPKDAP